MSYLKIDSFGRFPNNKKIVDDKGIESKMEVISNYKFTLAFENAKAKDYVTEKFLEPLIVGSVPVYLGAPNIDEFAPGENCFINVDSFPTIRSLADYLIELDGNAVEYEKFLNWKHEPYNDAFEKKLRVLEHPKLKRLCDLIDSRMTGQR